jgi:hypothetical protein
MPELTVVKLFYGDYDKCRNILKRYKNEDIHLMISSKTDKYYDLDLFDNVKQLTVDCNIKHIHKKSKTDQLTYLNISRCFPSFPSLKSLVTLHCDNTKIESIPTLANLSYLKTNSASHIQYQPKLEELNISYNRNISNLPKTPQLKTLICNDTRCVELPNYAKLEFLLCFGTDIETIPNSVCRTLQRCFTEHKPNFESKPTNLVELFNTTEDVHYLAPDVARCLEYDGQSLLYNVQSLIEKL